MEHGDDPAGDGAGDGVKPSGSVQAGGVTPVRVAAVGTNGDPGDDGARPAVSVVIAVGSKAAELAEVLTRYHEELCRRAGGVEFVVVLDGVSDEEFEDAQAARPPGANVRLVRLNHPFGESIALTAGFRIALGEIIVTVPSYLQVHPADIHPVIDLVEDGADVVAGYRKPRVDSRMNRLQSTIFNGVMRQLTGSRLHDMNCPVRAIRRKVLDDVSIQGDMVRFLPVMAQRHGFRVAEVRVRHLRERGKSGFFGVAVYIRRFLDIINLLFLSKFTRAPLRFFGIAGIMAIAVGVLICGWLAVDKLAFDGTALRDKVTLVLGVLLIVLGVQTFSIGLVGEIIIFTQAKNLKEYRLYDEPEETERKRRRRDRGPGDDSSVDVYPNGHPETSSGGPEGPSSGERSQNRDEKRA